MGRSTASCFRIITCGKDSVDTRDDVEFPESKGSSDTRGWSFGKRSARHRVLSNTVITETSSSSNKESPQTVTADFQTQPKTNFQEKTSVIPRTDETPQLPTAVNSRVCDTANFQTQPKTNFQEKTSVIPRTDETPQLPTAVNSRVRDTGVATEDDKNYDVKPDELVIVVIQASIRGFLAQKEMLKLKNVVKLQAAIRGHLVRRHAVGTLRCIQAIIKMQALVRARRARLLSEVPCTEGTLDQSHVKENGSSKGKGNSVTKPVVTYISIEKLLSNKFAHQLLESTPRTKQIYIKCDPSRSDSAWKWLERWMSVSSPEVEQPQKVESTMEQQGQEKETGFASEDCESTDMKANIMETIVLSKSEGNLITPESNNSDFQECQTSSSSKSENLEPTQPENSSVSNIKEVPLESLLGQTKQSELISEMDLKPNSSKSETENEQSQMELKPNSSKPETENVQSILSGKSFAPEQVETEGKKFAFGTRKASNPAFIAVQSKFEGLSSTANSVRSTSSYNRDFGAESNSDSISSTMENAIGTRENLNLHNSEVKVGRSESGTELSISSTLDSPDGSEDGEIDVEHEAEVSEVGLSNPNSSKNVDIEANGETSIPESDLPYFMSVKPEKLTDGANGESVISVTPIDSLQGNQESETIPYEGSSGEPVSSAAAPDSLLEEQKPERNPSNLQIEMELAPDHDMDRSSPEVSPTSHVTGPEFQTTPSSQLSVKGDKTSSGKRGYNRKRRSLSAGKQSPSNPNHDLGARGSVEKLDTDHKTGKRRNSFGSGRHEDVDQEPRDSNSSNSIPSYMQATESARAKALANSSPRSSPDVNDKDIYVKKRHSLPGANGRQGSPRVQRSSRSQQGAKGNSNPHERKWQR